MSRRTKRRRADLTAAMLNKPTGLTIQYRELHRNFLRGRRFLVWNSFAGESSDLTITVSEHDLARLIAATKLLSLIVPELSIEEEKSNTQ